MADSTESLPVEAIVIDCAVAHARCHAGPLTDWFTIHLIGAEGVSVCAFCPRHALVAEVLVAMGIAASDIIRMVQNVENGVA